MFDKALLKASLPPSFYEAGISLIHKMGKDPVEPGSYRPISLLNVDYEILAKVLATRLKNILPTVISQDQTGFIKDRHLFFNTSVKCSFQSELTSQWIVGETTTRRRYNLNESFIISIYK